MLQEWVYHFHNESKILHELSLTDRQFYELGKVF